ncbi:MAG: type VI secretion system protein TssA [Pseudomonadota bacterium]
MASGNGTDITELLTNISDEFPSGVDIRLDISPTSLYQTIKIARSNARAAERQGLFPENNDSGASPGADPTTNEHWQKILELSPEILRSHAKDLEIACWYTEALLRRYGFSGLRGGFALIQGLIQHYWDGLFPMPDEEGIESRVSCLAGLNGEGSEGILVSAIRNVIITEGQSPGPFSFWQCLQAQEIQRLQDDGMRQRKTESLGFSLNDIERSINESSTDFFIELRDDIEACLSSYKAISNTLDELCGANFSPPTRNIISVLEDALACIKHLGKHKFPLVAETNEAAGAASDEPTTAAATSTQANTYDSVINRDVALKQLSEISDFFRKTEPHSPISYVLEKAVKWAEMPLSELVLELIPDASSREHFSTLTGVDTDS